MAEHGKPGSMEASEAPGGAAADGRRGGRSRWSAIVPVVVFAALAALFAVALGKGDPSKLPSALIGKPVPAFALPPLSGAVKDGKPAPGIATAELATGAPVVVNFWASWCQPCSEEHPFLVALADRGVRIVGINYKDQPESAAKFLVRLGNPYSAIGTDVSGRLAIEWGVYGMPETFVVDGGGTIVDKHVGPITREVLQTKIIPAIERARPPR